MFYTCTHIQHFKCQPDSHANVWSSSCGKIDATEPFRLAAALRSAWTGLEVRQGVMQGVGRGSAAGQPFCLCLCLWRLFGGCRSHSNWTQKQAMSVAPGTMQQSTHLTMSAGWLKGAFPGGLRKPMVGSNQAESSSEILPAFKVVLSGKPTS